MRRKRRRRGRRDKKTKGRLSLSLARSHTRVWVNQMGGRKSRGGALEGVGVDGEVGARGSVVGITGDEVTSGLPPNDRLEKLMEPVFFRLMMGDVKWNDVGSEKETCSCPP